MIPVVFDMIDFSGGREAMQAGWSAFRQTFQCMGILIPMGSHNHHGGHISAGEFRRIPCMCTSPCAHVDQPGFHRSSLVQGDPRRNRDLTIQVPRHRGRCWTTLV